MWGNAEAGHGVHGRRRHSHWRSSSAPSQVTLNGEAQGFMLIIKSQPFAIFYLPLVNLENKMKRQV